MKRVRGFHLIIPLQPFTDGVQFCNGSKAGLRRSARAG